MSFSLFNLGIGICLDRWILTGVWFLRVVPAPLFEPWASNARAGRRALRLRASNTAFGGAINRDQKQNGSVLPIRKTPLMTPFAIAMFAKLAVFVAMMTSRLDVLLEQLIICVVPQLRVCCENLLVYHLSTVGVELATGFCSRWAGGRIGTSSKLI